MPVDNDIDVALTLLGVALCKRLKRQKRSRKCKTRNINQKRKEEGFYYVYISKMKLLDQQQFFTYTRMDTAVFDKLLWRVKPLIKKRSLPDSVLLEERLALTLHFLSQGASMQSIAWMYHLGLTTVHQIIHETATAIWKILHPDYVKPPDTCDEWLRISQDFQNNWNFPNCLGALDGKYINIHAPTNSNSSFNKKNCSIVLFACCDANYKFTIVDVGSYGEETEGDLFRNSVFGQNLEGNLGNIPQSSPLPNTKILHPYNMIANESFPLKTRILRPYPERNLTNSQRIFNYRLARARKVIEDAFGLLVCRWRILKTRIVASERNIDILVKAAIALHNYIIEENLQSGDSFYCPAGFADSNAVFGSWKDNIDPLVSVAHIPAPRASAHIYRIRDELKSYFVSPQGTLPWQYTIVN